MLNYRRPIGMLDVGLMYLAGRGDRDMRSGNGFVWTLSCGREDSWRPGAQMGYLKYYYQPRATYVEHTMNGMADYMDGFRGIIRNLLESVAVFKAGMDFCMNML